MLTPHPPPSAPDIHHLLSVSVHSTALGTSYKWNYWASQVALIVKNPPAVQETQVPSLGQEDALEKEMATPSSILAWKILRTEEPVGLLLHAVSGHD